MLYLTLFVAFRFYGVLAVTPVFVLMVAVAALGAALAVLQDARALAVIGALGGFATPLLVATGSGNHVALFGYYLVLDLGIAAVAWHRTWRSLNLIGFLGTFVVATAWGVLKYQSDDYLTSQGFLIAFFVLFVAIMLMPLRAKATTNEKALPTDAWVQGALLFGLPTITFVLQHGLVRHTEYGTAVAALVLAAFYIGMATWMRSRPAPVRGLRGQPGRRHRLHGAGDSVRARRAQHRGRVGARRCGPGLVGPAPVAPHRACLWLRAVAAGRRGDGVRLRAPRRADGGVQRLPLQRADGGRAHR